LFLGQNSRGMALNIRVEAPCDTVLLVSEGWSGPWHFSDDTGSSPNPSLRIERAADGLYALWVGTFAPSTCPATLILEMN